jgi:hypothetical protein
LTVCTHIPLPLISLALVALIYSTRAYPSPSSIICSTLPNMQIKALLMPRVIRFLLISTIRVVGIVAICLVIGAEIQEIVRCV